MLLLNMVNGGFRFHWAGKGWHGDGILRAYWFGRMTAGFHGLVQVTGFGGSEVL